MSDESFFRFTLLGLYLLFVVIRIHYGVRVIRSGGRVSGSLSEDAAREGRVNSVAGALLNFVIPLSALLYAIHPAWVARLSFHLPAWLRLGGAALSLVCLALLVVVHRALGRHWSLSLCLRDEHRLVTHGPYARVRHPMYTALFGYMLGLSLLAANWVVAVPRAIQLLHLYARIGGEEAMMLERFGEDYREYAERTGRLLPSRSRRA